MAIFRGHGSGEEDLNGPGTYAVGRKVYLIAWNIKVHDEANLRHAHT